MKNSTVKVLVYLVIFLGVLNIATLSTIGYRYFLSKNDDAVMTNGNTMQQNYNGRAFRDRLQLSPDQMTQFRVVNERFRSNARRINIDLIQLRKEMLAEMKTEMPDTVFLNHCSDSIGLLHAELKKFTYKYYQGISGICNDGQLVELNKIFEEFFINEIHFRNRGQFRRGNRNGFNQNN